MARETDERVRIWERIRLGGERGVDVAREGGYGDANGISHDVKGLGLQGVGDKGLRNKLEWLKTRFSSFMN